MEHLAECNTEGLIGAFSAAAEIPDKLYFRTGEVANLAAIKPYVLRFWESEFPTLGPKKSGAGHRLYRRKDVEMVLEIKRLLYDKRFTIAGARQMLENRRQENRRIEKNRTVQVRLQGELFGAPSAVLVDLRRELREILSILNHSTADHSTAGRSSLDRSPGVD